MTNVKGVATLESLMTILGIIGVLLLAVSPIGIKVLLNRPGQTESRAAANMELWIAKNKVQASRSSCAPDSDGDGYGSCSIVTVDDKKIYLDCPASWWMNVTGATGCKELESNVKFNGLTQRK